MSKIVLFGNEAREKIKRGIDLIANSIKVTLGPKGRNVVYSFWYGDPVVTKDGINVGRQISSRDQMEEVGIKLVRQVAQKTVDDCGDGTTTSALLAQSIFTEGLKVLGGGSNPILIKKGIDLAVTEAITYIAEHVLKDPSQEDLMRVATISANNDPAIASVVCEAIQKAGPDGVITIEDNYKDATTYIHVVEGMQLNEGWSSQYFVTNKDKMEAVYPEAYILIADYGINHIQPLMKIIEMVIGQEKKPLIIIADITGQALETLVMNRIKAGLPIVCCKAPYFGDNRTEQLTDLAILTGGRVVGQSSGLIFDKLELSDLGRANVVATKHHTTFTAGSGQEVDIKARIGVLQASIESTESDYEKEKLQERLAKLTSGVAVIKVGATTEVELKEKKFRTEDALHASRAALEEGVIPGGGLMLLKAAKYLENPPNPMRALDRSGLTEEEKIGWKIIARALQEPIKQIATNAGLDGSEIIAQIMLRNEINYGYDFLSNQYGDLMKIGVIDPFKVARLTIANAASVAGTLLTTEVCIVDEAEEETAKTPKAR